MTFSKTDACFDEMKALDKLDNSGPNEELQKEILEEMFDRIEGNVVTGMAQKIQDRAKKPRANKYGSGQTQDAGWEVVMREIETGNFRVPAPALKGEKLKYRNR